LINSRAFIYEAIKVKKWFFLQEELGRVHGELRRRGKVGLAGLHLKKEKKEEKAKQAGIY
jgi:hypothetical protein